MSAVGVSRAGVSGHAHIATPRVRPKKETDRVWAGMRCVREPFLPRSRGPPAQSPLFHCYSQAGSPQPPALCPRVAGREPSRFLISLPSAGRPGKGVSSTHSCLGTVTGRVMETLIFRTHTGSISLLYSLSPPRVLILLKQ